VTSHGLVFEKDQILPDALGRARGADRQRRADHARSIAGGVGIAGRVRNLRRSAQPSRRGGGLGEQQLARSTTSPNPRRPSWTPGPSPC